MPRRFAIASVSCFCSLLTAQTTWTVPTNAPTLQAAIDQAQPGDTITTLANYIDAGNVVLGKAVTLLGCRVHCGDNQFGLRINGIAGGSRIELRNCTIVNIGDGFFGNGLTPIEALSISQCRGPFRTTASAPKRRRREHGRFVDLGNVRPSARERNHSRGHCRLGRQTVGGWQVRIDGSASLFRCTASAFGVRCGWTTHGQSCRLREVAE